MNKHRRVPYWLIAVLTLIKNECSKNEHCINCPINAAFDGVCLLDAAKFPSQWELEHG